MLLFIHTRSTTYKLVKIYYLAYAFHKSVVNATTTRTVHTSSIIGWCPRALRSAVSKAIRSDVSVHVEDRSNLQRNVRSRYGSGHCGLDYVTLYSVKLQSGCSCTTDKMRNNKDTEKAKSEKEPNWPTDILPPICTFTTWVSILIFSN